MATSSHLVSILIVEDEIILAQDMAQRFRNHGYDIAGNVDSVDKAVELLQDKRVDIVIIDIMLSGDKDGIELAGIINERFQVPFLFLTSHADQASVERAKKVKPYAYLLKPFNDKQLVVAIELALVNFAMGKDLERPSETPTPEEKEVVQIKDSLFLKKGHHFERVSLDQILYLEADNNYCTIYTEDGRFVYSTVLKNVEKQLPQDRFLRIHRSFVVNIDSVTGFEGNLLFLGSNKVPVSKSHREEVFRLFKTL